MLPGMNPPGYVKGEEMAGSGRHRVTRASLESLKTNYYVFIPVHHSQSSVWPTCHPPAVSQESVP